MPANALTIAMLRTTRLCVVVEVVAHLSMVIVVSILSEV